MAHVYVQLDQTGTVPVQIRTTLAPILAPIDAWTEVTGFTAEALETMMLTEDGWLPRPICADPVISSADGVLTIRFSGLPPGATVSVTDRETGQLLADLPEDAGVVEFSLCDAGAYVVSAAGLPMLPWGGIVTC